MKAKVIAIEGVDGSGKSTQIELLKKALSEDKFIFLKEPGSTDVGLGLRKIILENNLDLKTEIMLFYSARNELILKEILPALKSGVNIIIDRFELSTLAYQIYGNKREDLREFLNFLSKNIVPEKLIDKYYFFDLSPEEAKKRINLRNEKENRFDEQDYEFFNLVREGYKKEIKKFNHKIIDASKEIEDVKKEFQADLFNFLKND